MNVYLYCTPIKFTVQPDCEPPVIYFPDGITVNSGGLQYNERNYADNENHAKEHNPICPFWNDYAADILYIVSEARYWQNYNRNPADDST